MAFQFVDGTKILEKNMGKSSLLQNIILSYYRPIVKKEVILSQATPQHEVLCVGGGYFPCTAILFHQLSGATVTVLDNDLEAVRVSKKLVQSLGYGDFVNVQATDGIDMTAKDFDIVHIAMQVSPKEDVFQHLHNSMTAQSKILIRTPKQHLERGYQPFSKIADTWVKQVSYSNIERTMLYVR